METTTLNEKIKHYTHYIIDQNKNKWEVIESSDLEDINETYHQEKLKLLDISNALNRGEMLNSFFEYLDGLSKQDFDAISLTGHGENWLKII